MMERSGDTCGGVISSLIQQAILAFSSESSPAHAGLSLRA
jgi:hypothetical protein